MVRLQKGWRRLWTLWLAAVVLAVGAEKPEARELVIEKPGMNGWFRISLSGEPDEVLTLESSRDFQLWDTTGVFHGGFDFLDPRTPDQDRLFYRAISRARTSEDDWKNQIQLSHDEFMHREPGAPLRWVKFAISMAEPWRVYYQNSYEHLFHYDFASARLPGFIGMPRPEFDGVSLRRDNQEIVLGAVLLPPGTGFDESPPSEFGIQFVGLDPYPPEQVRDWIELVRSTVTPRGQALVIYMPVHEQRGAAQAGTEYFARHGIVVGGPERWVENDQCYAHGWAVGRLVYVSGNEIQEAYADGRLGPGDILLTDSVPAEVPFVAGIVTLSASTPNSHVAILAKSYGVPFVFLHDSAGRDRALGLAGGDVALIARAGYDQCGVRIVDLEGQLDPDLRDAILALKATPEIEFLAKEPFGGFHASTDGLEPEDIRFFGGKAANYGVLRRSIPDLTPPAVALSIDLWDGFMDQPMGTGTLRTEISARLSGFSYPADLGQLRPVLAGIRDMIEDQGQFNIELREAVFEALSGFDPLRKIRFRSSTNLEDSQTFTGAGLYDSYSGCLEDDLDGDGTGPCACDPQEPRKRGVFRAIRKVYASFYNENAFLERLRHGVDETQVGMGVLVHYSYPDDIEWANGVGTLRIDGGIGTIQLVTQKGAISVTNPDGSAQPEVLEAFRSQFGTYFDVKQRSALVPLGGYVMDWEEDYHQLAAAFWTASEGYRESFPERDRWLFDFEYKKIAPGSLVVKQIREVPQPDTSRRTVPFLLNQPEEFQVFQGEFGDVFANHRLKSEWLFETENVRLDSAGLGASFYAKADWTYLEDGTVRHLGGAVSSWPEARHSTDGSDVIDGWRLGEGESSRTFQLRAAGAGEPAIGAEPPLRLLGDLPLTLQAEYSVPQPRVDYFGVVEFTTSDVVRLAPRMAPGAAWLRQERDAATEDGIQVQTIFFWPPAPTGVTAGYTAPLAGWEETTIQGLSSEPIVLRSHWAQTYRPEHHNFSEHFIFEPRLDPAVPTAQLAELESNDVRALYVLLGDLGTKIMIVGIDGAIRSVDGPGPKGD